MTADRRADHRKQQTVNRSEYQPTIAQAAADLTTAAGTMTIALRHLEDQRRGLPGSGFGGSGNGGSSSPVERALGLDTSHDHLTDEALDELDFTIQRDRAQAKLDEFEHLVKQAKYVAQRLRTLTVGNSPHAPSDRQRAEMANTNQIDKLCEHCTRHRPTGKVEEVHVTGDVGGILKPTTMGLCRWCYDFVHDIERLPSKADILRHNDGKKRTAKRLEPAR